MTKFSDYRIVWHVTDMYIYVATIYRCRVRRDLQTCKQTVIDADLESDDFYLVILDEP